MSPSRVSASRPPGVPSTFTSQSQSSAEYVFLPPTRENSISDVGSFTSSPLDTGRPRTHDPTIGTPSGEVQEVSPLHFCSDTSPKHMFPQVGRLGPPPTTRYPAKLGSDGAETGGP